MIELEAGYDRDRRTNSGTGLQLRPIGPENCGDGVVASATQSLNREINVVGVTPKVSAAPLIPLDARRQGE